MLCNCLFTRKWKRTSTNVQTAMWEFPDLNQIYIHVNFLGTVTEYIVGKFSGKIHEHPQLEDFPGIPGCLKSLFSQSNERKWVWEHLLLLHLFLRILACHVLSILIFIKVWNGFWFWFQINVPPEWWNVSNGYFKDKCSTWLFIVIGWHFAVKFAIFQDRWLCGERKMANEPTAIRLQEN